MLYLHWILCAIFILFPAIEAQTGPKVKPVTTHLRAKWPDTPFMLEASEYLADENPASFWSFVELVNNVNISPYDQKSEREKYDDVIALSSRFLSPSQIKILKFSLSIRNYSPKIEMFRQMALDRNMPSSDDCEVAVDINGIFACSADEIHKYLKNTDGTPPIIFEVDHRYPGGENSQIIAVLYGELGTEKFKIAHDILKKYAEEGSINYILRPLKRNPLPRKVSLSGYGVELQIKSTEYKAQDDTKVQEEVQEDGAETDGDDEVDGFNFSKLKSLHKDHKEKLDEFRRHLIDSSHEMAPLKVWQLQHLSMQAAQRIMSTPESEQLSVFTHTAQNFPSLAQSLIRTKIDDKMKKEILSNQNQASGLMDIQPTDAALFINGMYFDLSYNDVYTLLEQLKNEQRAMEGLFKLGIRGDTLTSLLQIDSSESKQEYGIDIRDTAIFWLNDIENDKAYYRWPSSVTELLRPAFPGMMRSIRKNFHNFVVIADPTKPTSIEILKTVADFFTHVSPIRFGIVFAVNSDKKLSGMDDPGIAAFCAFNYVIQSYDDREDANLKGLQFLIDLYSSVKGELTVPNVTGFFKSRYKSEDLDDIFGSDSDFDVGRQLSKMFVEKGGFREFPQVLLNGIPLSQKSSLNDEFEETVVMEVLRNTQLLQKAVYKNELSEGVDIIDWFMARPNIMPRLNDRILSTKLSTYVDMSGSVSEAPNDADAFSQLTAQDMTSSIAASCHYITTKVDAAVRPLTLWVVSDFGTEEGRLLLLNAVKYTRESNGVRVCPIDNSPKPGLINKVIQVAHKSLAAPIARQFLVKILDADNSRKILSGQKKPSDYGSVGFDVEAFESRLNSLNDDILRINSIYASKVLNLPSGKSSIIANGRNLGAFAPGETFTDEDFSLLEKFYLANLGDKIVQEMTDVPIEDSSDIIMKVSGVLQTKPQSKTRNPISLPNDNHSVIKIPAKDPDLPTFDILAICDPLSEAAQRIGPILLVLQEVLNANIRVALNAIEKHSEMPLKSFYRFVLQAEPQFTDDDVSIGPSARFVGLPESPILTQNYHVPENWLVEVVKSIHDLDNIKLEQVETGVHSDFELEHLLLEGHCFEQSSGNPPRGLQFTLGTRQKPVLFDTIVMANLGYFQLKANPGAMLLRLREGRSADIYNIFSHDGTDTPKGSSDVLVAISNFRSHVIKVRVAKKPEKQDAELLSDQDDEAGGGIWGSITSTFSSVSEDEEDDGTINIFSVASGHLYERFLRIMMVSALRHTSSPIKFWFLKNFISPSLKDSLPVLADELGFQYELVQYKWPRWLHQQTEKQRIIWGYKILFLDVLFPLDVKKIIFVDADLIVRGDLKELRSLDLDGAPYGFVPFCDSRKEMEGFRFWKQGYWRNHLAGRKYHISALFVVDLKRFRRIAAGDRLRGQYQGLSQDPNSLSNLDQDLPNNMIHQVKIKSLPMEWLWCETWCDDASKSSAKGIDLCNNPLTKEAKLDAAQRIISEWNEYDQRIKDVLQNNLIGSKQSQSKNLDTHTEL